MTKELNPYQAPQATLSATRNTHRPTVPCETRWYYVEYGFRYCTVICAVLLMYLMFHNSQSFSLYWLYLPIAYLIVIWPSSTLVGLLLGVIAAVLDRWLQDRGWREPFHACELDR